MDEVFDKEPAILDVLDRLRTRLGLEAFHVADLYQRCRDSVDIYHPRDHHLVVYITCRGEVPGRFGYQLELPPRDDGNELYEVAGRGFDVDFEELATVVARHLQTAEHS
jgi:hypothetical protein